MILFVHGPPRRGDLNFAPRMFGKFAAETAEDFSEGVRAVAARSPAHAFQILSLAWFERPEGACFSYRAMVAEKGQR